MQTFVKFIIQSSSANKPERQISRDFLDNGLNFDLFWMNTPPRSFQMAQLAAHSSLARAVRQGHGSWRCYDARRCHFSSLWSFFDPRLSFPFSSWAESLFPKLIFQLAKLARLKEFGEKHGMTFLWEITQRCFMGPWAFSSAANTTRFMTRRVVTFSEYKALAALLPGGESKKQTTRELCALQMKICQHLQLCRRRNLCRFSRELNL